jgi:hypothetical protein
MTEDQKDIWAGVLMTALIVGLLLGGLLLLWLTGNWRARKVMETRRPRPFAVAGVPQNGRGLPGARWQQGGRLAPYHHHASHAAMGDIVPLIRSRKHGGVEELRAFTQIGAKWVRL